MKNHGIFPNQLNITNTMSNKKNKKSKTKNQISSNAQIFRRTALATAITVAVAPIEVAVAGSWRDQPWGRNIELSLVPTTEDRGLMAAQLLQPVFGNNKKLTYADLRAIYGVSAGNTEELNIGLGHRQFYGDKWLLGGYLSFDYRNTDRSDQQQMTFGLEALSIGWDANFNYYLPISDEDVVGTGVGGGVFVGNSFFANGVVEEALEGFDFEVGALLPFLTYGETRLYIGTYYFDGEVAPDTGIGTKARMEFRPRKDITLGVAVQNDDLYGTEASFQLKYSFGYSKESGVRTMNERMIQFHERDIDIKETSRIDDRIMESGDPDHRVTISSSVVHIDNVKGSAAGDGSFENPYDSFASCIGKSCDTTGAFVYVGAGGVSSTVAPYDTTTFTMANNQLLFGRGVSLFGFGGDAKPTLTAAGNVINLANNNEVAGFTINAAGGHGIYGFNSNNFNIHDNRITGSAASGIGIYFDEFGPQTATGIISNNTITGSGQYGVFIWNKLKTPTGKTFTQDFTIANNTISGNASNGISFGNLVYDTNSLTQTLNITGNTISGNGGDGISIYNYTYNANTTAINFTQNATISGNTITGNGTDGIYIQNEILNGTKARVTTTIANNTITGNADDGINILNTVYGNDTYRSSLNNTVTISGNNISNNASDGIYINNYVSDDGVASQTILTLNTNISNNTINSNGEAGIHIYTETDSDASVINQTITIANNVIKNNADDGIYIDFYNDYFSKINSNISITGNTITGNGEDGIDINFDTYEEGVHKLNIAINNNTITGNANNGINIYIDNAYGYQGGGSRDVITINNNNISNNGDDGIYIDSFTTTYGILNQVITISGNTINNNGDDGIDIYNYTTSYGISNQTIVLSNNTIKNNADNGVELHHYGAYNAVGPTFGSTQKVTFTGNTITGNGRYDVAIYNGSDTYSIQTVKSGGGNTIGTIFVDGDGTQSVTLP